MHLTCAANRGHQSVACLASFTARFYAFFTPRRPIQTVLLHPGKQTQFIKLNKRCDMDAVFVVMALGLWLALLLMVWGLAKLAKPPGERP
jgi:hypothetical protein